MRDGLACGRRLVESYHMAEQWVSPPRNDVPDTGQVGSVGDFCSSVFLMKSCQWIPRIICWQRMWKALSFRLPALQSSCRSSVHASEPYSRMDNIQVRYKRSFICSWSRDCRQTVHRLHGSGGNANPSKNIWLIPACGRLNRAQLCKFGYFLHRLTTN